MRLFSVFSDKELKEMRKLMETKEDFNSMRLPRSFANVQRNIFKENEVCIARPVVNEVE